MAANRTKTIEYMLPMTTGQVGYGTAYTDSADITVYIPETTDRAFLSCTIEMVAVMNTFTNSSDPNGWGIRCSCDAGTTWTTATHGAMYTETDENISMIIVADMTAEFTARFSGASDTVRWGWYINADAAGPTYNNVSARLIITYEYDDTAHATRVKTVRIPIESYNGRITTGGVEVAQGAITNQLPALKHAVTPFLPEASVTIRQAFLEIWTNSMPNDVTDNTLTLTVDAAGSSVTSGTIDNTLDTALPFRLMLDVTAEDWTSAHALNAITSASTCCAFVGGWLTVTYEYDHSSSTTILNSLLMGMAENTGDVQVTGDQTVLSIGRYLEEPGTLTLVQSGVYLRMQSSGASTTVYFKVGGQTATGYTPTADGGMAGDFAIMHRIDAGGYRGAGVTLARGENTFTITWYAANANRVSNVSALMILNYTSDKAAGGDGLHAHSTHFLTWTSQRNAALFVLATNLKVPKIIESDYWLMSVAPCIYAGGTGVTQSPFALQAELQAGEDTEAGWVDLFNTVATTVAERGFVMMHGRCRSQFRRWPNDTDSSRMNVETTRYYRMAGASAQYALALWLTHHSHTWSIAGTVSGYVDVDGAGLAVKLYRCSDGLYIGEATTTAGGAFTMTWYDNTEDIRAICEEDSSHVGASAAGQAS